MMVKTRTLRVDSLSPEAEKINEAADVIRRGGLVAFPTETVYGLGANALDPIAAEKIFRAKNRPADNPLIVHVASVAELRTVADDVPKKIEKLAEKIWPGPVTILLRKSEIIPGIVSGETGKVAVRIPAHPVALALIKRAGVPIAAPSANTSTRPSPTNAAHVLSDLRGRIDLVLDGGDAFFGIESTIVDTTSNPYRLLRPGAYSLEELGKHFGRIRVPRMIRQAKESGLAIVPGMKYRHYAPSKPLYLVNRRKLVEDWVAFDEQRVGVICSKEVSEVCDRGNQRNNVIVLGSERNLYSVAKNLFDSLRRLDSMDVKSGVIQSFEEKGIGLAIMNRIKKAASRKMDSNGGREPISKKTHGGLKM